MSVQSMKKAAPGARITEEVIVNPLEMKPLGGGGVDNSGFETTNVLFIVEFDERLGL